MKVEETRLAETAVPAETPVRITPHSSGADREWDTYAGSHPWRTVYHGTAYRDAVAEAFGLPFHGLVARDTAGVVRGVLPLFRQKSRLFGDHMVSVAYASHGGPLADSPDIARELLVAAAGLADELGCDLLEVRDTRDHGLDWPLRAEKKVLMIRELPDTPEALGKELGSKLRSQCRRALKEGAEVIHGGAELVEDFYPVFAANMRDLGTPVYPRRWFEILARHLDGMVRLVIVRMSGRPVAAAFLLRWGDTVEIPWAASVREFNRFSVNMLLYREALDWSIESGAKWFDFGRSTLDEGTYRFKSQWGAEPVPIHWLKRRRENATPEPELNPGGGIMASAVKVWQKLPLGVANWLGPKISPVKRLVKSALRSAAAAAGPHRWRSGPSLLVLTYHRVLPEGHPERASEQPGMLVSPEILGMHLATAKKYFTPVHLDDWLRAAAAGTPPPGRSLAVTFDDGWRDNYDYGFSVLQDARMPATVFLVSDMVGSSYSFWPNRLARALKAWSPRFAHQLDERTKRHMTGLGIPLDFVGEEATPELLDAVISRCKVTSDADMHALLDQVQAVLPEQARDEDGERDLMDWAEARQMLDSGLVRFGSHTRRHTRLRNGLTEDELRDEVEGSRRIIEARLGADSSLFCYPNGDCSPDAYRIVRETYDGAASTHRGWHDASADAWLVKRVSIHEDVSRTPRDFLARLAGWPGL
ncbi:MAG: FemAB family PEP-CTERM system-associated protein [Gammaproteobacteria bacterium]